MAKLQYATRPAKLLFDMPSGTDGALKTPPAEAMLPGFREWAGVLFDNTADVDVELGRLQSAVEVVCVYAHACDTRISTAWSALIAPTRLPQDGNRRESAGVVTQIADNDSRTPLALHPVEHLIDPTTGAPLSAQVRQISDQISEALAARESAAEDLAAHRQSLEEDKQQYYRQMDALLSHFRLTQPEDLST